ncbi:class I SAM-dependent methyltransferase [Chlamydiota bacterium]
MTQLELDPRHYLRYSKIQMGSAAEVIAEIAWTGNERLLDVGSGDGKITALLNELAGEAVGVDLSANMVAFASEHFPNIHFEQQNAEEMLFERPFDLLTSFSALHWVRRPERALEKMARALKPGGKAYILTYPEESPGWGQLLKTAQDPLFAPYTASIAPIHSAKRYNEMAQQAGFEVLSSSLETRFAEHDSLENIKAMESSTCPFRNW